VKRVLSAENERHAVRYPLGTKVAVDDRTHRTNRGFR